MTNTIITINSTEEKIEFEDMQEAIDFIIDDLMTNDIEFTVTYE